MNRIKSFDFDEKIFSDYILKYFFASNVHINSIDYEYYDDVSILYVYVNVNYSERNIQNNTLFDRRKEEFIIAFHLNDNNNYELDYNSSTISEHILDDIITADLDTYSTLGDFESVDEYYNLENDYRNGEGKAKFFENYKFYLNEFNFLIINYSIEQKLDIVVKSFPNCNFTKEDNANEILYFSNSIIDTAKLSKDYNSKNAFLADFFKGYDSIFIELFNDEAHILCAFAYEDLSFEDETTTDDIEKQIFNFLNSLLDSFYLNVIKPIDLYFGHTDCDKELENLSGKEIEQLSLHISRNADVRYDIDCLLYLQRNEIISKIKDLL